MLEGSGRVKLDDEIVELSKWDAIRISPQVTRAVSAGPMEWSTSPSAPPRAAPRPTTRRPSPAGGTVPARVSESAPPRRGVERRVLPTLVGRVDGRPGRDDLVDPVEHVGGQLDVGRAELGLEMLHRARPDDRRRHRRVADDEREREMDQADARLLGEPARARRRRRACAGWRGSRGRSAAGIIARASRRSGRRRPCATCPTASRRPAGSRG